MNRVYISEKNATQKQIHIKCDDIRGILNNLYDASIIHYNTSDFNIDLTEQNIVNVIKNLSTSFFIIEPELVEWYNIISSWDKQKIKEQYVITDVIMKLLRDELQLQDDIPPLLIVDRNIKYQYYINRIKPTNLIEYISYRKTPDVWVDSRLVCLDELVSTLIELKRFPTLFIIQDYKGINQNNIISLESILKEKNISYVNSYDDKIYDDMSNIMACISTGELPKYMFKTNWTPLSVVSIDHILQNSKQSIFATKCDLRINFTQHEPIIRPSDI